MNDDADAVPLRLQRHLTFAALFAIAVVAWAFLVRGESAMTSMADDGPLGALMRVMMRPSEVLPYFLGAALMWVVMMIAMMTPAMMPMVAVLRGVARGPHRERTSLLFAGGYPRRVEPVRRAGRVPPARAPCARSAGGAFCWR